MGTMSAQGTLPVSGASIAAEPITNTFNHIMTTYNGGNITTSNVDLTAIASLTTAHKTSLVCQILAPLYFSCKHFKLFSGV